MAPFTRMQRHAADTLLGMARVLPVQEIHPQKICRALWNRLVIETGAVQPQKAALLATRKLGMLSDQAPALFQADMAPAFF